MQSNKSIPPAILYSGGLRSFKTLEPNSIGPTEEQLNKSGASDDQDYDAYMYNTEQTSVKNSLKKSIGEKPLSSI